jgi:hypothetical protein
MTRVCGDWDFSVHEYRAAPTILEGGRKDETAMEAIAGILSKEERRILLRLT